MKLRSVVALAAVTVAAFSALPAHAALPNGPAASADAYGLLVDAKLLPTKTPVAVGPLSRASQDYPVGAATPAEAAVAEFGPLPGDSSLVNHIGVVTALAGANAVPNAVASAQVKDVSLLGAEGQSLITADLVRAQANSDCLNDPNATGTTFVNLKVGGQVIDESPDPNTTIDLGIAKVILNEQRPAFDGRGIVVNAIHVLSTTTGDPLFRGDIIVAHAMSTVNCTNGAGSTGSSNVLKMVKDASPNVVRPGGTVTYSATVSNTSQQACLVNKFIEHLAPAFDFVSTSGDFGSTLDDTVNRPGGGVDLILGNGKTIAAGGTFRQTFVVRVKDGAADGIYYNNLEILCANLGNFVKGLDAPVQVTSQQPPRQPTQSPTPTAKPECSDGRDNDGDGLIDYPADPGCQSPNDDSETNRDDDLPRTGHEQSLYWFGGFALLAMAVGTRRLRKEF